MTVGARSPVVSFFASVLEKLGGGRDEERISRCRALISAGRSVEALETLDRLLGSAGAGGRIPAVVETLALKALVLEDLGETEDAMRSLARALSFGEREGYVNVFVNEGAPMAALLTEFLRALRSPEERLEGYPSVPPEYVRMLLAMLRVRATLTDTPGGAFVSRPYVAR